MGWNNTFQKYWLHVFRLGNSFVEKYLWSQVDSSLNISPCCALVAKKTNHILGCIRRTVASRLREMIVLLNSVLVRQVLR